MVLSVCSDSREMMLKNRSAALYKKTYAALSGEYENFANKLNGESCREAKTDGSRVTVSYTHLDVYKRQAFRRPP